MKKEIGKPFTVANLFVYGNELSLRHLFCHLNVKTKEPIELKDKIGEKLESCANLPVVAFSPIENNLPYLENKNDLSKIKNI